MSVRSKFRRAIFPFVCLLSLGAAGYTVVRRPFAAWTLKRSLIDGTSGDMKDAHWASDPVVVRVGEELIADPRWPERLPPVSREVVIRVLSRARSQNLAPVLRTFLTGWNRQPIEAPDDQAELADLALSTLLRLDTTSAKEALTQLEQEFPPFPRPYAVALLDYLRKGRRDEVMALVAHAIKKARQIPDVHAPGWTESRAVLEDLRKGLNPILNLQSAKDPLWEIFVIQFLDGDQPVCIPDSRNGLSEKFADELLQHLPEIPTLNANQAALPGTVAHAFEKQPSIIAAAWAKLLDEAGGDLRKIHWLKKLVVLEVLAKHGTDAELAPLDVLRQDPETVRTLARERPDGESEEGRQDGRAPLPPGWKVVRTRSLGELADKAQAMIQGAARGRRKAAR